MATVPPRVNASRTGTTSSGAGIASIDGRCDRTASRYRPSSTSSRTASRTAAGLSSSGISRSPSPCSTIVSAFRNWSAPWGIASIGTPALTPPSSAPEPPCDTKAAEWGRSLRLGHEPLDPDVVADRAQRRRIAARADGDDDLERLAREPVEDRPEDLGLLVELGAHRHVDERPRGERIEPGRKDRVGRVVEPDRAGAAGRAAGPRSRAAGCRAGRCRGRARRPGRRRPGSARRDDRPPAPGHPPPSAGSRAAEERRTSARRGRSRRASAAIPPASSAESWIRRSGRQSGMIRPRSSSIGSTRTPPNRPGTRYRTWSCGATSRQFGWVR